MTTEEMRAAVKWLHSVLRPHNEGCLCTQCRNARALLAILDSPTTLPGVAALVAKTKTYMSRADCGLPEERVGAFEEAENELIAALAALNPASTKEPANGQ